MNRSVMRPQHVQERGYRFPAGVRVDYVQHRTRVPDVELTTGLSMANALRVNATGIKSLLYPITLKVAFRPESAPSIERLKIIGGPIEGTVVSRLKASIRGLSEGEGDGKLFRVLHPPKLRQVHHVVDYDPFYGKLPK